MLFLLLFLLPRLFLLLLHVTLRLLPQLPLVQVAERLAAAARERRLLPEGHRGDQRSVLQRRHSGHAPVCTPRIASDTAAARFVCSWRPGASANVAVSYVHTTT